MKRRFMKTLIAYSTRHGCTEKCAIKLQNSLTGETQLFNLKKSAKVDLNDFGTIIIGGSIHAGQIQKKVKQFCLKHIDLLKTKKIGLFICCMEEGEKATKQLEEAFPEELIKHASATGIFGGEFNFEKMNFIERAAIRKIAGVDKSVSKIFEQNIAQFAKEINEFTS